MTPIFKTETRDTWCARLEAAEVPHSPAYDADEALEDPQAKHLRIAISTDHPEMGSFTTVRAPYSFDDSPEFDVMAPPTLDEHGNEIRAELNSTRKAG